MQRCPKGLGKTRSCCKGILFRLLIDTGHVLARRMRRKRLTLHITLEGFILQNISRHLKTPQNTLEHQLEEPHKARARLVSCSSATWQARPS
jgi:hypothetical protein